MTGCRITDEYSRRGIDTIHLENDSLRVEVLTGKGADITVVKDKETDVNVLFEAPHEWCQPGDEYVGAPSDRGAFLDHYPGGWQMVLPAAGGPAAVSGAEYGAHGESTVLSWDSNITEDTDERVSTTLSTKLRRYPLAVERSLMLESESRTLEVTGTITNLGDVAVPYQWLEHIALGPPLLGPEAQLEVPCETVRTDDSQADNARLPADESFAWPTFERADTAVDLRCFPERDASVLDNALLADLTDGYYTVLNESVGLETTVRFDADRFDSLWYWGALGGYNHSPFFGRAYALGLEPCTSTTKAGLDEAIEEGTAEEIEPGEMHRTTTSITVESQ